MLSPGRRHCTFALIQIGAALIWPLPVANDQLLSHTEVGLTPFCFSSDYGKLMAGSVISVLPLLITFLIRRRRIIESVALTGLKGRDDFGRMPDLGPGRA